MPPINVDAPDVNDPVDPSADTNPEPAPDEGKQAESPDASTDDAQDESDPDAKPAERVFTQAELDEIVKREKAKAEAKAARRLQRQIEQTAPRQEGASADVPEPKRDQFTDVDEYVKARVDWQLQQERKAEQEKQHERTRAQIRERTESMYAEAAKLPGFDREDFNDLPLTPTIGRTIIDSEDGPLLMAYLCKHPDEVERIAKLRPERQAAEIGKLEAKAVEASKAQSRASRAPAPIEPVSGARSGANGDPAKMSHEEYRAWRAKQGAPWAPRIARRSP